LRLLTNGKFQIEQIPENIFSVLLCLLTIHIHRLMYKFTLDWEPSVAQITNSFSRHLPALVRFYREIGTISTEQNMSNDY